MGYCAEILLKSHSATGRFTSPPVLESESLEQFHAKMAEDKIKKFLARKALENGALINTSSRRTIKFEQPIK